MFKIFKTSKISRARLSELKTAHGKIVGPFFMPIATRAAVKNLTNESIDNIEAVATIYDENGNFITSESALIDYRPLLAGQTSPFSIMVRKNPAMTDYRVEFKEFSGGTFEIIRSVE